MGKDLKKELVIRLLDCEGTKPCVPCGKEMETKVGLPPVLDGTRDPVCGVCAKKHAPQLTAALRIILARERPAPVTEKLKKVLDALIEYNCHPFRSNEARDPGWFATCPFHPRRGDGLRVYPFGDIECRCGCATQDVLEPVGLRA